MTRVSGKKTLMVASVAVLLVALAAGMAFAAPNSNGYGSGQGATAAGTGVRAGTAEGTCAGDQLQTQTRDQVREETCAGTCIASGDTLQHRYGQADGASGSVQAGQGGGSGANGNQGETAAPGGDNAATSQGDRTMTRTRDQVSECTDCDGDCAATGDSMQTRVRQGGQGAAGFAGTAGNGSAGGNGNGN